MRSLRFTIVWLLLVAGISAAADLLVLIRLQVADKHVELDRSLLGRFIATFFRHHFTPPADGNDNTNWVSTLSSKNDDRPFPFPQAPHLLSDSASCSRKLGGFQPPFSLYAIKRHNESKSTRLFTGQPPPDDVAFEYACKPDRKPIEGIGFPIDLFL